MVLDLPGEWWSRFYEYEWCGHFAGAADVVLDAACGICHPFKFFLTDACREVHACDVDARIVDDDAIRADIACHFGGSAAQGLAERYLRDVKRAHANLVDLPYRDALFDTIFCISVLEHLDHSHVAAGLREFARVMKDDGLLVLTFDVPSANVSVLLGAARDARMAVTGPLSMERPPDAVFSDEWNLYCFRMLLRKADHAGVSQQ